MLKVIVFVCGAALMGLELVAARVLAPAMGNSIYVWGSVISTVMVALSLGYWIGGHAADRWGASRLLPLVIAGAAFFTVLAPPIAAATLSWASDMGPRLGSLVASGLIFFVPALLLAMVSPLGVRLATTRGLEHIGRSAGSLYSISTAGSIVGTLATSFWLIPLLSLEPLIVWTGFLLGLAALAALGLAARSAIAQAAKGSEPSTPERLSSRFAVSAALGLVLACTAIGGWVLSDVGAGSATNATGETILFRADTQYHRITVTEDETVRHLRFDRSHQSAIYLDNGYESAIRYPDYLHLTVAAKPDAKRVLVLGLGGGTLVKRMWRDYPQMSIDAVEIDPVVVEVSQRYFGLPDDPRIRVFAEDARRYIQRTNETYDIIVIDAYYADGLPFHLTTTEFLGEVKARLAPDGVVAYNVISSVEGDDSKLFRSMYRTAGGVWSHLAVFPLDIAAQDNPGLIRNIIVQATDSDIPEEILRERIASRVDGRVSIGGFDRFGEDLYTEIVPVADVPELTDSHAPTDSLITVN
ncbi:MAG: fused MFS/spermidine synthase [Actinomycetota bacterium]|nr:fused MFS/spermidine synthase [Actinomycetota bacterium]